MHASMTLLGDTAQDVRSGAGDPAADANDLPAKAQHWLKQFGLTLDQVEQVFHLTGGIAEIIVSIPGGTKREQVRNAYVLCGLGRLLANGESTFDDQSARRVCELGGFFDGSNHMKYMKSSEFVGSRDRGWVLTAPGLRLGAELVTLLSSHDG